MGLVGSSPTSSLVPSGGCDFRDIIRNIFHGQSLPPSFRRSRFSRLRWPGPGLCAGSEDIASGIRPDTNDMRMRTIIHDRSAARRTRGSGVLPEQALYVVASQAVGERAEISMRELSDGSAIPAANGADDA
jgi:hypothetical protein